MNNKDNTIQNIQHKTIFTAVKTLVETITLDYVDNPEGFKIFYDADSFEPLYGYYFYQTLQPYSYQEKMLNAEEFMSVLRWRNGK